MPRPDGRAADELRAITFERDYTEMTAGSVLVTFGKTRVLCTASIDEDVPRWMRGTGKGWVTAEYSMLPGSSPERIGREAARGKQSGRTMEIQRLIGRSLRAVCDMRTLGERQVLVDCDVLQADGGTRTASICGGYLALHDALEPPRPAGGIKKQPLTAHCAAISVGVVGGVPALDLPYVEDSTAEVDMNVVMTSEGRFVEVQGTAEGMAFSRERARRHAGPRRRRAEGDLRADGRVRRGPAAASPVRCRGDAGWSWSAPRPTPTRSPRSPPSSATTSSCCPGRRRFPTWWRTPSPSRATPASRPRPSPRRPGSPRWPTTPVSRSTPSTAAPGVWSARYAGDDATYAENVAKLLHELKGVAQLDRTACFRTVAMVRWPDGREVVAEGVCDGLIAVEASGARGFGYDPVFVPADGDGRTFAEMTADEKHAISHRGRAFRALLARPQAVLGHDRRRLDRVAADGVYQPRRSMGQTSSTSSPSTR